MVRNTKARRSVNQVGVKKHKISSKAVRKNIFERIIPKKYKTYLHKCAEKFFKLFLQICCKLNFVRFSCDRQGNLTMDKTKWELAAHYFVIVLQIIRMVVIAGIIANRAVSGILDVTTLFSVCTLLPFIVGFSYSASLLLKPQETVQLLNVLPVVLSLYQKDGGKAKTMFQNTKNAILIMVPGLTGICCALVVPAVGFLVDQLPVSLYHIIDWIIGRPELIPYFVWKLIFLPLEFLTYAHIMTIAGFNGMMFQPMPNNLMTCTAEMRKMQTNTVDSRMELGRKYYVLQVYVHLVNSWIKFMIAPTIISISLGVVFALYITFRHTEIAILVYLGVASMGASLLIVMFWVCFEVLNLIKSSEAIVANLNSSGEMDFLELSPTQRMYMIKYGKATRPIVFDIGDFVDYSIDVPISIWDEILNQLFFMLTF